MKEENAVDEWFVLWAMGRWMARHDLFWLGTHVLKYGTERVDERYHRWFCDELSKEEDTLFLMPRDHTKTTWGINVRVVQDVLLNPDWAIFIGSVTNGESMKDLRVIKQHLSNAVLTTLFPEILCKNPEIARRSSGSIYSKMMWHNNEVTVRRDTKRKEPTIDTGGVDQFKTGNHFDRMYFDDLINEMTVASDVKSARVEEFVRYFVPMGTRGCVRRFYGTIYNAADFYHGLIDRIKSESPEDEDFDMRVIQREVMEVYGDFCKYTPVTKKWFKENQVKDPDDGEWKVFIYRYFNPALLSQKRVQAGSDYMFFCQYHNKIIGADQQVFPPPYPEVKELPGGLTYYMTVDLSFVPSRTSDFTAITVCGYGNGDLIYIAEAIRLKEDMDGILRTIRDQYLAYDCKYIGIEKGPWMDVEWGFDHAIKRLGWDAMPFTSLKLSTEAHAKDNRIRGMGYFFKRKAIVLKEGLDDLKRELNRYPGNTRSKNDMVDSLSMQRELISWRRAKPGEIVNVKPVDTWGDYFKPQKQITYQY